MKTTAALPTRRLGQTDMNITRVGFGAWAIGGGGWAFAWGDQDDRESIAAIRYAVARGVNWIDTAPIYGLGHSEELVRQALAEIPAGERPFIFTKCGLIWDDNNRKTPARRIGERASLRREVEASLKRLGVERIDLYQMHWPAEDGSRLEDYWRTLVDLKNEGKVRAVGLSNHNAAHLEAAERIGHVDTLQPPFSSIRRSIAEAELPWCRAHHTGVIVYSPMQSGLLTGRFTAERARSLSNDDWRSRNPQFAGDNLERNLKLARALAPIAQRRDATVASIAVAWTLGWPGVTGAIVGARDAAQVDGWLGAATLELEEQDYSEIAAAIAASGAGDGPVSPNQGRRT
jgi:aryl-alcohol dehydrogenase-like predicted oxidoreductase